MQKNNNKPAPGYAMNLLFSFRLLLSSCLLFCCLLFCCLPALAAPDTGKLTMTVMSPNLPLEKRIRALRTLYADQFDGDKIIRSFCVWDMLGRAGPVYAAVDDQRFRSLHYGLQLNLRAYQDEDELVRALQQGECDAALMSGSRALAFNRFTGTLEAPGAVPDIRHLQVLMQVIASPEMAGRMESGGYVVLGVASLGEHYAYTTDPQENSLRGLRGKTLAVPAENPALQALAAALQAQVIPGPRLGVVNRFARAEVDAMLAPLVAFHVAGSGQIRSGSAILNYPLAQSTIQLIGRQERFPTGLAQILREDFLFRFSHYVRRVERERKNIAPELWREIPAAEKTAVAGRLRSLRRQLGEEGVYDSGMLRLEGKVRCRITPQAEECQPEG